MKKYLKGAAAVLAADVGSGFLPDNFDFAGLPVRKGAAAVGGFYLAAKALGGEGASLKSAVLGGIASLAAAELASKFLPVSLSVGPVDVARLAAGAAGVWASDKVGL